MPLREVAVEGQMMAGWIVSNAFALALIIMCWRLPKVGRAIIGLGFAAAAVVNTLTALNNPQAYVQGYGPEALFPFYENFIYGPLAKNPTAFILPIAMGQLAVGLMMFFRGAWFKRDWRAELSSSWLSLRSAGGRPFPCPFSASPPYGFFGTGDEVSPRRL
jgi:hypothetical protein